MGLDMYMVKKVSVKNWEFMKDAEKHKLTIKKGGKPVDKSVIDVDNVNEITQDVGYWRKANAIHDWFVQNVQDGNDNCGQYYVDKSKMEELLEIINKVLKASKLVKGKIKNGYTFKDGEKKYNYIDGKFIEDPSVAEELLPTTDGFFFGDTQYSEWYIEDLKYTKKLLKEAIKDKHGDYYYSSSW